MSVIITIKNTSGNVVADISSKEILKDVVSVALFGRGAENYVSDLNQNFVKLLERGASSKAPENPMVGEMWFDLNDNILKCWNGSNWEMKAAKIAGKTIDDLKAWVISYIDITDKFDKSGGTITGDLTVNENIYISGNIIPYKNSTVSLGTLSRRFKTLFIKDGSIFLGDNSQFHITKDSFVYNVFSNDDDISAIPTGTIILNADTGVAMIKRSLGKFDSNNAKFGQLAYDLNNAVRIGYTSRDYLGDKAIFGPRYHNCTGNSVNSTFSSVQLSTPGNAQFFGNSTRRTFSSIGVTGGNRALWHTGGWPGWTSSSQLEYVTFSTPGNANVFGNCSHKTVEASGVSDGTKGVFSGGWNGWYNASRDMEYVSILTPDNAKNFGTSIYGRQHSSTSISDGTRGVQAGGYSWLNWNGVHNSMEYIVISTPSNSTGFGQLRWQRYCNTGNTNTVKGFIFGGWWSPKGSAEVITISTPSNSQYFGNVGNYFSHAASSSNGIKISVAGGWGYGWCGWQQIRTFTADTPNNSQYFGSIGGTGASIHFTATSGN